MILVSGARGTLGSRVVKRLLAANAHVRVIARDVAGVADLVALGAEAHQGDLLVDGWQDGAMTGVDHVVVASHGLVPPSRTNHPGAVDGVGARRLIDAAARAGVKKLVYVSIAGAGQARDAFSSVKFETERHLRASHVPMAVVRPTLFIETHALILQGEPARAGKAVQFFGPASARLNWVSADDVATAVLEALDDDGRRLDSVREVRGPDELSRVEVLGLIEAALGRTAKRQHLPLPVARLVHAGAQVFHPGVAHLLSLSLAEGAPRPAPTDAAVWVGPTRVAEVVERWARADATRPALA